MSNILDTQVVVGKGQFTCGAKGCSESVGLQSYEVNFGYVEQNRKKNALVSVGRHGVIEILWGNPGAAGESKALPKLCKEAVL